MHVPCCKPFSRVGLDDDNRQRLQSDVVNSNAYFSIQMPVSAQAQEGAEVDKLNGVGERKGKEEEDEDRLESSSNEIVANCTE